MISPSSDNKHFFHLFFSLIVVFFMAMPFSALADTDLSLSDDVEVVVESSEKDDELKKVEKSRVRPPASIGEAEILIRRADDAYLDGQYEDAAKNYSAVAEGGYGSADLLYNLGNAYWLAGSPGKAVLSWERALLREPRHQDALANLRFAAESHVDSLEGTVPRPAMERLAARLHTGRIATGFAIAWSLMIFSFIILRKTRVYRKRMLFTALVSCLAAVLLGGLTALSVWYHEFLIRAVVVTPVVQVRAGPAPRFDSEFEIHEGLVVRVIEYEGPYARVRLANERSGWVLRRSIERI